MPEPRPEYLETLDLLAERQRRMADDPNLGLVEVRAPWPVVPGWPVPPEPDLTEDEDE